MWDKKVISIVYREGEAMRSRQGRGQKNCIVTEKKCYRARKWMIENCDRRLEGVWTLNELYVIIHVICAYLERRQLRKWNDQETRGKTHHFHNYTWYVIQTERHPLSEHSGECTNCCGHKQSKTVQRIRRRVMYRLVSSLLTILHMEHSRSLCLIRLLCFVYHYKMEKLFVRNFFNVLITNLNPYCAIPSHCHYPNITLLTLVLSSKWIFLGELHQQRAICISHPCYTFMQQNATTIGLTLLSPNRSHLRADRLKRRCPLEGEAPRVCFCYRRSLLEVSGSFHGGWTDLLVLAWWAALEGYLPPPGIPPAAPPRLYHTEPLPCRCYPSYWGLNAVAPQGAAAALTHCTWHLKFTDIL